MTDWLRAHEVLLWWIGAVSALTFVATLFAVPWLILRIPDDYFLRRHHYVDRWKPTHPVWRAIFLAAKNLIGAVIVLAGIVMLVFPGQGILTIVVGLLFVDFPGKYTIELWLARRPPVLRAINWMRQKSHRPPLKMPPH